ncbi:MAG: hypothetical protein NVSMB57_10520 [Actinomycetota bacterium]
MPGIGISIMIGAVGAILRYAVTVQNRAGFNIHTAGVILMIVGLVGLVLSLLFWASFSPFGRHRASSTEETIVRDDAGVEPRRVVRRTTTDRYAE